MWNQIFNFKLDSVKDINDIVQKNVNFDLSPKNDYFIKKEEKDTILFYSPNIIEIIDFNQVNGLLDSSSENDNSELSFINCVPKIRSINSEDNDNNDDKDSSIKKVNDDQKKEKNITNNTISFKNKDDKIFKIEKALKLGRKKKNCSKKGKHDKFQRDNIIRRFKVQLMKNIHKFINNCFDVNSPKYANKISVIKKISPYYKSISKRENIKWFNSKIKDIFSQKLSNRIVTCDLDYNKKLIKKIYEKGKEQKVIKNLEKTIKEFWDIYIKDDNNIDFIGFETIKDDINKFRKSGETEEYIAKYIEIAKKYEDIFNDIIPREKKPKKDIDI